MDTLMIIMLIIGIVGMIITEYLIHKNTKEEKKWNKWKLKF